MTHRIDIPTTQLQELYISRGYSTRAIGKILNCNHSTVLSKLEYYGIDRRRPKEKLVIDGSELRRLYVEEKLSTYKIARLFHCTPPTILRNLKYFKIVTRKINRFKIAKEQLERFYLRDKFSISEIAHKFGCSPTIVFRRLVKYRIRLRTGSEALTIYPKRDFDGDKAEMAYMLGFRYGDLNAALISKELIMVKCCTTKIDQVELIRNVYGKYGHCWVGKPNKNGVMAVDVTLNGSFDFLLKKTDKVPEWILTEDVCFWEFFGGYTDAEGNIGVYGGRARVRVGSYDKILLGEISEVLSKRFGINNRFRLERPKGTNNQNGDFWRVSINEKQSILKLFGYMKPILKHQKRLQDLVKAELNIAKRTNGGS